MILLLQGLRFPPAQGDSDPRSVAIISSSWTELFGQEVEGFDELENAFPAENALECLTSESLKLKNKNEIAEKGLKIAENSWNIKLISENVWK